MKDYCLCYRVTVKNRRRIITFQSSCGSTQLRSLRYIEVESRICKKVRRTVSSSPTSALADFDQQTQRPVSRAARQTSSVTNASQLPVRGYGTRC